VIASTVATPLLVAAIEVGTVDPLVAVEVAFLGDEGAYSVECLAVALAGALDRRREDEPSARDESLQPRDGADENSLELGAELHAQIGVVFGRSLEPSLHRDDDPPIEPRIGLVSRPRGLVR